MFGTCFVNALANSNEVSLQVRHTLGFLFATFLKDLLRLYCFMCDFHGFIYFWFQLSDPLVQTRLFEDAGFNIAFDRREFTIDTLL